MKANFDKALNFVLADEGGYVHDKLDRGGETNFGISQKAYPNEDIRGMTLERATEIYLKDYWTPIKGDDLPSGVDYVVFDSAVQHGPKNAGIFLQRALNRMRAGLITDGSIGVKTLKAIKAIDGRPLIADILRERDIFYMKIIANDISQERFSRGWANRLAKVAVNSRDFA